MKRDTAASGGKNGVRALSSLAIDSLKRKQLPAWPGKRKAEPVQS